MGALTEVKSLFSQNMKDIAITLNGQASTPIVVKGPDAEVIVFVLYPVEDKVIIYTSDIVKNFHVSYDAEINNNSICSRQLDNISIQSRNETDEYTAYSVNIDTIFGGYDSMQLEDEYDFLQHNFLTWRPQVDYVVKGIKQQLSFVICNTGSDQNIVYPTITNRKICAKVYFRTQLPKIVELYTVNTDNTLYRIDCSYDTIKNLALDIDDEITAYDIFGTEDSDIENCISIKPQRFIVKNQSISLSHFFFQNTLGGFDTISATGELKEISQGDIQVASVRNIETEVSNTHSRSWEVNTGYIGTQQEENLWREFLQSTNRYILFRDGSYRRVIVEEYKAERTKLELGSFTFKFHYAEKERGVCYPKTDLEEYI